MTYYYISASSCHSFFVVLSCVRSPSSLISLKFTLAFLPFFPPRDFVLVTCSFCYIQKENVVLTSPVIKKHVVLTKNKSSSMC